MEHTIKKDDEKYSLFLNELQLLTKKDLIDRKKNEISTENFSKSVLGLFKCSTRAQISEDYISLDTFFKQLMEYYKNIINERNKIKNVLGKSYEDLYFGSNRIYLSYHRDFVTFKDGYPVLVDFSRERLYVKCKKDIFRFTKTMTLYESFKNAVSKTINLSDITTLSIKADRLLKEEIIDMEIKMGDLAIISISIISGKVEIATHSNVGKIDVYLLKNSKRIFKEICMSKELLKEILNIFNEYKETLKYL